MDRLYIKTPWSYETDSYVDVTSVNFNSKRVHKDKIFGWQGIYTRLHGKFQPVLKLNVTAGTVLFFIFIVVHRGSTHAFMNFHPGQKLYSNYMAKFSARAEISARLAPTGLKISPCNRNVNFYRICSWARAEILHVISPKATLGSVYYFKGSTFAFIILRP